ncbi:MAG: peroxidase family protein, partial [Myxococcota bacterium]
WEQTRSPAGAIQWKPVGSGPLTPDAHDPETTHSVMMLTTDLSLRYDPAYERVSRDFYEHPEKFERAFAEAWYKLTHRDMGPHARLLGPDVPEPRIWQDPVPTVDHPPVDASHIEALSQAIGETDLSTADLVFTAWASASTYRDTDRRGGANGARIRLMPQREWSVNQPERLARVLRALESVQAEFNAAQPDSTRISLADLIVLGGKIAIERAAKQAGADIEVPFAPGRTDAVQQQTDIASFGHLEPQTDGFRNHLREPSEQAELQALVERANFLTLTPVEMTVLLGGLRVLGVSDGDHGVWTEGPGALTNEFFVHLLDPSVTWRRQEDRTFAAFRPGSDEPVRTGTCVDLLFGSHSQLRGLSEVYAAADAQERFVHDFVAAWHKVMNLDNFRAADDKGDL